MKKKFSEKVRRVAMNGGSSSSDSMRYNCLSQSTRIIVSIYETVSMIVLAKQGRPQATYRHSRVQLLDIEGLFLIVSVDSPLQCALNYPKDNGS
jgi:hypothetical protein